MKLKVVYYSDTSELAYFVIQKDYDEDILDYMKLFKREFSELDYFNENLLEWYKDIKDSLYKFKTNNNTIRSRDYYNTIISKVFCDKKEYSDIYNTKLFKKLSRLVEISNYKYKNEIRLIFSIFDFEEIFREIDNILVELEKNNGEKVFRYIGFNENIEYKNQMHLKNRPFWDVEVVENALNSMIGREGTKLLNVSYDGRVYYYKVDKMDECKKS